LQAIEYLISQKMMEGRPDEIANFLFTAEGLNPSKIGDYLSDG
jgi:Sec7-like guanine-nucleotide exchange factor